MLEICAFVNCCFVCSVIFIEYHSTMHCNKVLQACRYIAIYLGLPSECQYMACRLTSDIITKECQHYWSHFRISNLWSPFCATVVFEDPTAMLLGSPPSPRRSTPSPRRSTPSPRRSTPSPRRSTPSPSFFQNCR